MSRVRAKALFLALFLVALRAQGVAKTDPSFRYFDPTHIDLTLFLPPPPDLGSARERDDEREVAATISARNSSEFARAQGASFRTVFFFAPSIGPDFTRSELPLTAAFFVRVGSDVEKLVDLAKAY